VFATIVAASLAAVPPLQILSVRWFAPLSTGTALQRVIQHSWGTAAGNQSAPGLRILWTPANRIPRSFFRLVWASEDQRFFEHEGFDWIEMRKAWEELGEGKGRGASTITMQTARTVFLWQGRSWIRKALEAYYTFWMELILDKRRIFYLYVNVAEMGPGVYGIGAAARFHFDRRPGQLTLQEQALIVAILPNPRAADLQNPDRIVRARQQRVLRLAANAKDPPALREVGR